MKKITLFAAAFLMSSVAFGQVNWGKFEGVVPKEAKNAIEKKVAEDTSICSNVARQVRLDVVNVQNSNDLMSGESSYRVHIVGPYLSINAKLMDADTYHPPANFSVYNYTCFNSDM